MGPGGAVVLDSSLEECYGRKRPRKLLRRVASQVVTKSNLPVGIIFTTLLYCGELVSVCVVSASYSRSNDRFWMVLTLLLLLVSSVMVQLTLIFVHRDLTSDKPFILFMHLLLLGPLIRCLESLVMFYRLGREEEPYVTITRKKHLHTDYEVEIEQEVGHLVRRLVTHRNAFKRMAVIQAFLGSTPQLTLQLYVSVIEQDVPTSRVVLMSMCLLSVTYGALVCNTLAIQIKYDDYKIRLRPLAFICILLWRSLEISTRVTILVLFGTVFKYYGLAVGAANFLVFFFLPWVEFWRSGAQLPEHVEKNFSQAAWLGLNIFLFVTYFLTFDRGEQYYYTRQILGSALAWARASAKCLNFNSMLILLPICRNLLSFVRGTCRFCGRTMRQQLDHNLTFHKLVAYMIALHSAIHIIAHFFNVEWYIHAEQSTDDSLPSILSQLHQTNDLWLNPIQSKTTIPLYVAFITIPGLTGVIITLALILMITSSMEQIRRNYFEVFWYTHHLFVVYFVGLVIHGIAGLVRGQTAESLKENNPKQCAFHPSHWGPNSSNPHCEVPEFGSIPAESWKWVLAPIVLYAFERVLRIWRSYQKVIITKVIMHPSKVLEIQMCKKGFSMEVGQYVFLNCPSLSYLEWHPFTLTSAPEEDFFSVHIRVAGDWTETLIDTLQQPNPPMPRIMVDGPFGTASEDVFQYEVAMLVGAGIGVTPFASVLKSIWYKFQHGDQELQTRKIYFYWICRETGAFAWFKDLLSSLEQEMEGSGRAGFLSYHLYLTGWNRSMIGHVALHFEKSTDLVTGLKQKTSFGRPRWNKEFSAVAATHPRSVVGVFLCGPEQLATTLKKYCRQHSSLDPRNVQFYFNKENF